MPLNILHRPKDPKPYRPSPLLNFFSAVFTPISACHGVRNVYPNEGLTGGSSVGFSPSFIGFFSFSAASTASQSTDFQPSLISVGHSQEMAFSAERGTPYQRRKTDINGGFSWVYRKPGHRTIDWTSLRAFPARNRDLLFECDVFFFGTARSSPSHSSDTGVGILSDIAGIVIESAGEVFHHRKSLVNEGASLKTGWYSDMIGEDME